MSTAPYTFDTDVQVLRTAVLSTLLSSTLLVFCELVMWKGA